MKGRLSSARAVETAPARATTASRRGNIVDDDFLSILMAIFSEMDVNY